MEGWMYSFTSWLDGSTDIMQSKKPTRKLTETNKRKILVEETRWKAAENTKISTFWNVIMCSLVQIF
jgi:hypothetical protein